MNKEQEEFLEKASEKISIEVKKLFDYANEHRGGVVYVYEVETIIRKELGLQPRFDDYFDMFHGWRGSDEELKQFDFNLCKEGLVDENGIVHLDFNVEEES